MLPASAQGRRLDQVGREFGTEFAARLEKLPRDEWSGPVRSPYGAHLVRVTALDSNGAPALAQVRVQVEREWESARRLAARDASYRKLVADYEVVVEKRTSLAAQR
jgi:parvulin-like peptidyl-prolyl isomerase